MASAWGSSWGSSWANSWGDVGAVVTPVTPLPQAGGGPGWNVIDQRRKPVEDHYEDVRRAYLRLEDAETPRQKKRAAAALRKAADAVIETAKAPAAFDYAGSYGQILELARLLEEVRQARELTERQQLAAMQEIIARSLAVGEDDEEAFMMVALAA